MALSSAIPGRSERSGCIIHDCWSRDRNSVLSSLSKKAIALACVTWKDSGVAGLRQGMVHARKRTASDQWLALSCFLLLSAVGLMNFHHRCVSLMQREAWQLGSPSLHHPV